MYMYISFSVTNSLSYRYIQAKETFQQNNDNYCPGPLSPLYMYLEGSLYTHSKGVHLVPVDLSPVAFSLFEALGHHKPNEHDVEQCYHGS